MHYTKNIIISFKGVQKYQEYGGYSTGQLILLGHAKYKNVLSLDGLDIILQRDLHQTQPLLSISE